MNDPSAISTKSVTGTAGTAGAGAEGSLDEQKIGDGEFPPTSPTLMRQESFGWRGGKDRQTTGIWMWSEPFFRTITGRDGGEETVALLLMDTQGMFDNETSMNLTAQIFGLSTFISSYQASNDDKYK
jgi:hypothetical protein